MLLSFLPFSDISPIFFIILQMRWGSVECLKDSSRFLKITNTSTIPASLQLFLRLAKSKFALKIESLVLEAGEEYDLEVTANVEDTVVVKEELHIMVAEGKLQHLRTFVYTCTHTHVLTHVSTYVCVSARTLPLT